jgi:hypothetical protein
MDQSLVPVDKIVDYYEEVILQRIEDRTSLKAGGGLCG